MNSDRPVIRIEDLENHRDIECALTALDKTLERGLHLKNSVMKQPLRDFLDAITREPSNYALNPPSEIPRERFVMHVTFEKGVRLSDKCGIEIAFKPRK
jgi:hypothetical protein